MPPIPSNSRTGVRIGVLLIILFGSIHNLDAVIVVSNGIDATVAAERDNIVAEVGTATNRPADDPFVGSGYMTAAPGWTSIQVSFIAENAEFQNDFGWFLYDYDGSNYSILETGILWSNVEERVDPSQIGSQYLDSGESFIITPEGDDADYYVGWFLTNPRGDTFYTINELNPNQEDHYGAAVMTGGVEGHYMGVEDFPLFSGGDADYNDFIFNIISETGLDPVPSVPEPAQSALVFGLGALLFLTLRIRSKANS